ncbi:Gti1/Pac2 family-domain-containing protein [Chytriomyces cf. hyalinus JEL632]|nr:Gti1/Pac2 family-domain-containing protein [Chytriomyces cf. hyalinus JEL632]
MSAERAGSADGHSDTHKRDHSAAALNLKRDASNVTYYGRIESPMDASLVIEACIKGILKEMSGVAEASTIDIRPGTVLVIHERGGSIQRWRDGHQWSPSRISGNFLIYREVERLNVKDMIPSTEDSHRKSALAPINGSKQTKPKMYSILPEGLTKKTISLIGSDRQTYRVISYYETEEPKLKSNRTDLRGGADGSRVSSNDALPRPSQDESFAPPDLYPKDPNASSSNEDMNRKRRKIVQAPQRLDRRYPEYVPQMADYPVMYPYRRAPGAMMGVTHETPPKGGHDFINRNGFPSMASSYHAQLPSPISQQSPAAFSGHSSGPYSGQQQQQQQQQYVNMPATSYVGYRPFPNSSGSNDMPYHQQQSNAFFYYHSCQYYSYHGPIGGSVALLQQHLPPPLPHQNTLGGAVYHQSFNDAPHHPFSSCAQLPPVAPQ